MIQKGIYGIYSTYDQVFAQIQPILTAFTNPQENKDGSQENLERSETSSSENSGNEEEEEEEVEL